MANSKIWQRARRTQRCWVATREWWHPMTPVTREMRHPAVAGMTLSVPLAEVRQSHLSCACVCAVLLIIGPKSGPHHHVIHYFRSAPSDAGLTS
jgi:hypothetical protein